VLEAIDEGAFTRRCNTARVLIWLNGAFGVGKTSLAFEMQALHPNTLVVDPEALGFALRRMQTPAPRGDFQDDPLWRELVLVTLERLLARETRTLIVPMTLVNALYFDEIVAELRTRGHAVHHFALMAARETILKRLSKRGDFGETFAHRNLERCVAALESPMFGEHVPTDGVDLATLARDLLHRVGLAVTEPRESDLERTLRRWRVWWRHVRLSV
jgi:hypothetical protein